MGGSSSTTGPHADTTRNVTISQANYGILVSQAFETQQQQQQATAPVVPAPAPDAEITDAPAVPDPAAPPVPAALPFRTKGPRPETYYGLSRGEYNIFFVRCEAKLDLGENETELGHVYYISAYLEGNPASV